MTPQETRILNNGNDPATGFEYEHQGHYGTSRQYFNGLTKREYFAGIAMQGLLSIYDTNPQLNIVPNEENVRYMAALSVKAADTLLIALEETK